MQRNSPVAIIGLDCAVPDLVFDRYLEFMPVLKALCETGMYGELSSTIPPITLPAWASMVTGKDPGQLGLYGFRNRASHEYESLFIADSSALKEPTLWQIIERHGKRTILLGVPPSYPPRPVEGMMVGCFLTPDEEKSAFTFPLWLKQRLNKWAGGPYMVDVKEFRTERKEWLLEQIRVMTARRFRVASRLVREYRWDLFMMVEIGLDRIHHGFWRFCNPDHRLYERGNPFENVIRDYYAELDGFIGELISNFPPDTLIMVVSDHGARSMRGGVCVNEWLIQEGWLRMKQGAEPGPLKVDQVDWDQTRAWAEGGYYARIFLNVAKRESQGIIPTEEYDSFRFALKRSLEEMKDPDGFPLGNRVFLPDETYRETKGVPPDLIVYLGNLSWRAIGTVGQGRLFVFENDRGPDDVNHAQEGIFIGAVKDRDVPEPPSGRRITGLTIYDVAPTVLRFMGLPIPGDMIGKALRIPQEKGQVV